MTSSCSIHALSIHEVQRIIRAEPVEEWKSGGMGRRHCMY